ncbi:MAG: hypothetical protein C0606_16160 [Hyphomicrobiales bacterium]|nr:MAG: hypothetical protein C0606_16160 [Hyphomicrobiales bacterium]
MAPRSITPKDSRFAHRARQVLIERFSKTPFSFDPKPLVAFDARRTDTMRRGFRPLAKLASGEGGPIFSVLKLERLFGVLSSGHSLSAHEIDWGIHLTEPQTTKAIVHLLQPDGSDKQASRLAAFLKALGTPDVPNLELLRSAEIEAERPVDGGRIDIEVRIPCSPNADSWRPILVEAKFGHTLTKGQLGKYTRSVSAKPYVDKAADFVVLAQYDRERAHISEDDKEWRFLTWRELWLRFERLRPRDDDPNFTIFLNMLWSRIGGLGGDG